MFRTILKPISLFRKNSHVTFRNKEQPKLYYDTFNMFMLSAFVKETDKNINNDEVKCQENHDIELTIICEITGCEKNKNNNDCSCDKTCIVTRSEISIICDLL
jgi:hypothetical protein